MDLNQFTQALRSIEDKDPKEFPDLVKDLKNALETFVRNDDLQNLGCCIMRMCECIMKSKEVKDDIVGYLEELIDCAIVISIESNFQVGFDALFQVFNATSEFYKTARIDTSLKYPLGLDRPLPQYTPAIGEQCDVVRPYITSTSFCGWTRATLLQIDNNKYTLQYINTSAPLVVRGEPWFAPLGSRTQDFEWRKNLQVGSPVEALLNRVWYKSTVVELGEENGSRRVRVSYRRFAENGDREDALGCKYFGLGAAEDEWMDLYSSRIQKCGKMANKSLCYYTFTSDQILPDDNYDVLFEKQYQEKPFHAIARSLLCKSLSILRFINTFTQNKGFEAVISLTKDPNASVQIAFKMLANATSLTAFIPRMDMKRYLPALHNNGYIFMKEQIKNLTPARIDMGYFCIDTTGRRLYSLSQVYSQQNELRKDFIKEFLDMNLEKKMLALRYINDLINPKKPYSTAEREAADRFLKDNHIFDRIFQANTHEQILTRTQLLLRYFIEKGIVSETEFAQIWHIVPLSDQRAHATIEKLIVEVSKFIPISFVQLILEKLLNLKETELTVDNLNLFRELKNREISEDYQMRILSYLWEVISVKSINIKTNIEEEVEKVFKVFVGGLKNPTIRVNVIDSMVTRLAEAKKIRNEIDLLRDFIMTYPEKPEMIEETDAPVSIYDAVNYLKTKNIYQTLLQVLENTKKEGLIREILNFMGFLFEHDFDDINEILKLTYKRLGPSDRFFEWVYKILKRVRTFIDELFSSTTDFSAFENLTMTGFEALRDMIFDINEEEKNIKIMKTYEYSSQTSDKPETKDQSTTTPGPVQVPQEKKQEKPIGPSLPAAKKHVFVMVSPFSLVGMRFLNHLILVIKNSRVYDQTVKLIIQFIVNLDYSITDKTEQYRKEFLGETIKEISNIISKNEINDKIKQELQVYINLFIEIFSQTEKNGLGDLAPHFQNIEGEKSTLKIENTFPRAKGTALERFDIVVNENCTIWKLKVLIGDIIKDSPNNIDVIKFVNPVDDGYNGKSLADMFFYDGESIKIAQKISKPIPKYNLINSAGEDLSEKFLGIVKKWFNQFSQEDKLRTEDMKKLSDTYWRGSLFRQDDRIKKIYEEHDKGQKGYLSFDEFKDFFYVKIAKNEHAIWKLINLAGYKNNLEPAKGPSQEVTLDVSTLPRRILSSTAVYDLIFGIFKNPTFKDVHLNFFRLLSLLQVSSEVKQDIEQNIYNIITESECMYELCYKLEVANSVLSSKPEFYYDFWRRGGVETIMERINKVLSLNESIYKLDLQLKNTVLPNLVRILNMYAKPLLGASHKGRTVGNFRINYLDLEDLLKKHKDFNEQPSTIEELNKCEAHLRELRPDFRLDQIAPTSFALLHNLMKNYTTDSSDFIPKLTAEIVRLIGFLSICEEYQFDPLELLYGVKSESLNYRRGCCNIIYFYIQDKQQKTEQVLLGLLAEMPNENKFIFGNYFSLLARIIESELARLKEDSSKDPFFINLANDLLDKLFTQVTGEPRNALIGDKVIMGILMALDILVSNPAVCKAMCLRKHEITEKCLFAYDIEKKIQDVEVTEEMLTQQKQKMHFKDYVICKTDDTRNIAYSIVAKLHEASKDEDKDFLEKYVLPVFNDIAGEIRTTTSKSLHVGLKNFGSTCYMNSMLQVLNSVGPFRNLLMKANVDAPLIKQLKELFASLFFSERADYAPKQLLEAFVPPINPGIQQDTTEFLNFLFDQVESGLSECEFSRLLDEIFRGANTAQMICHSCGYKKENKETFFSFGVEIEGKYDLGAALEGSHQGEVISDYLCDNCGNRGETTKRNILSEVPSVLFIHLRRIVFNYDMFVNMKIHTRLEFPDELNIEPYTKEGVELREQLGLEYMKGLAHNEEETKKFQEQALHGKEKDFYKLKLKGVIVHSGSADVGHYISIVPDGKSWCKFDDSRVSIFPQSGFEKECYGGTWTAEEWGGFGSSQNAYVLVYEKVIKNPITLRKGEEEVVIAYDEVKPHNSAEQYKAVWLDNHRFMVELHILDENYCKNFLKFACSIMSNSPHSNRVALLSEILYTVTYHCEMVSDLPKLFSESTSEAGPDILHNFVLKDKKKTFKLLFSRTRSVREFMAFYLQVVLFESYRKGDEAVRKEVIDFIHEYLANMTGEVAKNWMRIDGYFRFIELMVIGSVQFPELWNIFRDYHLISLLIDFVMEKNSPVRISPKNYSLGTKTNPMDFGNALNTILFLLRHSFGFLGENFEVPAIPEQYLFHLNDNDVTCLSHMDFYRKMLKERQNMNTTAAIIQRLCIRNLEFSRAISEPILTAIGCITDKNDEIEDLSHVVREVMVIKDEFWKHRADMLLGWGAPYLLPDNSISALDSERFVFTSTLFDIFPVECLFNYAYLYRANMSCFHLLKAIVHGCSVTEESMRFLASQPSLSYAFASYIDWIKLYVTNYLDFQVIDEKKKERLKSEADDLMKYIDDVLAFRKDHIEECMYKPLLAGKLGDKKEQHSIKKRDVEVIVVEINAYCLESQPTGSGNASIDKYLDGSLLDKKISEDSSLLYLIRKPNKGIALKMKPVEEAEDKEIVSLFDDYPDPATVNAGTSAEENKENEMKDEKAEYDHPVVVANPDQPIITENDKENVADTTEVVEERIDIEGIFTTPYFREIQIYNRSRKTKLVKLLFRQAADANVLLPCEISFKVSMKSNQTVALAKQDKDKNWGDIAIEVIEEDFDKQKHDRKGIEAGNWFKLYGDRSEVKEEVEDKKEKKEAATQEKESADKAEGPKDMESLGINCPICTFLNPKEYEQCEVCFSNLH